MRSEQLPYDAMHYFKLKLMPLFAIAMLLTALSVRILVGRLSLKSFLFYLITASAISFDKEQEIVKDDAAYVVTHGSIFKRKYV